jgi:integrase
VRRGTQGTQGPPGRRTLERLARLAGERLVFPSRIGTPLEPDNLRRSWGRIRKPAGLGDVRFHDIRHICVSLLLDLGVPPHIVRDIVGHSDIEVTMTIYAHAALDEKRKALKKLGDALG